MVMMQPRSTGRQRHDVRVRSRLDAGTVRPSVARLLWTLPPNGLVPANCACLASPRATAAVDFERLMRRRQEAFSLGPMHQLAVNLPAAELQ